TDDQKENLQALSDQEIDGRYRAYRAMGLRSLDREDRGQQHDDEPAEPDRMRPLSRLSQRGPEADRQQNAFDRVADGNLRDVVSRVGISPKLKHQQMSLDVLPENAGPGEMVRGVPDRDRGGALKEDLRILDRKPDDRDHQDDRDQYGKGETSDDR